MEIKFDDAFLKKLDKLSLHFNSTVNNLYNGGRRSKIHGSSVEFASFREYSQGDDFRRIDWNAYGRFEKLFIKLFLDEKQLCTNIFVDVSESMNFGTPPKAETGMKLAAAITYISASAQDKVEIISLSDSKSTEICGNITGKAGFYRALERISDVKTGGNTNLGASLKSYGGLTGAGGFSVLITDFMSDDNFEEALKFLLYKKQQVIILHVLSKEEKEPEMNGRIRLLDSENDEFCDIEANGKTIETYKKLLDNYLNSIKSFCMKTGITYIPVVSDDDIEKIMMEGFGE